MGGLLPQRIELVDPLFSELLAEVTDDIVRLSEQQDVVRSRANVASWVEIDQDARATLGDELGERGEGVDFQGGAHDNQEIRGS